MSARLALAAEDARDCSGRSPSSAERPAAGRSICSVADAFKRDIPWPPDRRALRARGAAIHSCVVNPARRIEFGGAALARNLDHRGRDVHVGKLLDDPGPCRHSSRSARSRPDADRSERDGSPEAPRRNSPGWPASKPGYWLATSTVRHPAHAERQRFAIMPGGQRDDGIGIGRRRWAEEWPPSAGVAEPAPRRVGLLVTTGGSRLPAGREDMSLNRIVPEGRETTRRLMSGSGGRPRDLSQW